MAVEEARNEHATPHAAVSRCIIRLLREHIGRGPTTARTTIHEDVVLVTLHQPLTKAEQLLVNKGRTDMVLELRRECQDAIRRDAIAEIGEITGRQVLAMLSANHIDPDVVALVFMLGPAPSRNGHSPAWMSQSVATTARQHGL